MGGSEELLARLVSGLLAALALGAAGLAAGSVDLGGAAAGGLLALSLWVGLGWRGFALLAAFVAVGTLATRAGRSRKVELGVAQERGGRRGARHALANASVPALAALAALAAGPAETRVWALLAAGALAAVTSDTVSSEIGQAYGGAPYLVCGFRRVAVGTDGAVSVLGSLAGLAGAAWIGVLAWGLGLASPVEGAAVTVAGLAGNLLDTVLGAALERRGLLGNEAVNLAASSAGGGLAWLAAQFLHGLLALP